MSWVRVSDSLSWSPGHQGKGYLLHDGTVKTWNVDPYLPLQHFEVHQRNHERSPIALNFEVDPDGGVVTKEPTTKIETIVQLDPRLYDAGQRPVFEDDFDLEHFEPKSDEANSPDFNFIMSARSPHRNRWTGKLCACGWGPSLRRTAGAGVELRRLLRSPDKAYRRPAGKAFLRYLKTLPEDYDALFPYLSNRFKKGDIRYVRPGEPGRVAPSLEYQGNEVYNHRTQQWEPGWLPAGPRLGSWLEWYEARQHPTRRGVDVMAKDFTPQTMEAKVQAHQQALQEEQEKRNWLEIYGDARPLHTFGPEAGKYKGWQVVPLDAHQAGGDSRALGHCIGNASHPYYHAIENGAIDAYSLRDAEGYPHVSWHINPSGNGIGHMQGKSGNPNDDYRDLISTFNQEHGLPDNDTAEEELEDPEEEYDAVVYLRDPDDVDSYIAQVDGEYDYPPDAIVGDDTEIMPGDPDWDDIADDYLRGYGNHEALYRALGYNGNHSSEFANALERRVDPTDQQERQMVQMWNSEGARPQDWVDLPALPANEVSDYTDLLDEDEEPQPDDWHGLARDYLRYPEFYGDLDQGTVPLTQGQLPGGPPNPRWHQNHYQRFHEHLQDNDYNGNLDQMHNALQQNLDWSDPGHQLAAQWWNGAMPGHQLVQAPEPTPYNDQQLPLTQQSPIAPGGWTSWQDYTSRVAAQMPWGQDFEHWMATRPAYDGAGHQLGYDPKLHNEGKGFILHDGSVWTWPTHEYRPTHAEYSYKVKRHDQRTIPGTAFHIGNGGVFSWEGRTLSPDQEQQILQADPRLTMGQASPDMGQFGHGRSVLDTLDEQERGRQSAWHWEEITETGEVPGPPTPSRYTATYTLHKTPNHRDSARAVGHDEARARGRSSSPWDWRDEAESSEASIPCSHPGASLDSNQGSGNKVTSGKFPRRSEPRSPDESWRREVVARRDPWSHFSDYQGWTNWETWNTALMMDNEQPTYNASRQLVQQGGTPDQLRDWLIRTVLGPYNQERIREAQDWNAIDPDERRRMKDERDRSEFGDAAVDLGSSIWEAIGGPDPGEDDTAELIDPSEVNWYEIYQSVYNELVENNEYAQNQGEQPQALPEMQANPMDQPGQDYVPEGWLSHVMAPAVELREWLADLGDEAPSIHHDTEDDFIQAPAVSTADDLPYFPPANVPKEYKQSAMADLSCPVCQSRIGYRPKEGYNVTHFWCPKCGRDPLYGIYDGNLSGIPAIDEAIYRGAMASFNEPRWFQGATHIADSPITQADATNDPLGKNPALIPSPHGDPDYLEASSCPHCYQLHRPDEPCPDSSVAQYQQQERQWYNRDPNQVHGPGPGPNGLHDQQMDLSHLSARQAAQRQTYYHAIHSTPIRVVDKPRWLEGEAAGYRQAEMGRRPFVYHPDSRTVYLGEEGSHHADITGEIPEEDWDNELYHEGEINLQVPRQAIFHYDSPFRDTPDSDEVLEALRQHTQLPLRRLGSRLAYSDENGVWSDDPGEQAWEKDWLEGMKQQPYLYHVSPRRNREAIQAQGLMPTQRSQVANPHDPEGRNEPGVYFEADPEMAMSYWGPTHGGPGDYDLWRVPGSEYSQTLRYDPFGQALWTPHGVRAELHGSHRHSGSHLSYFDPDTDFDDEVRKWATGGCGVLAHHIHQQTGWPLMGWAGPDERADRARSPEYAAFPHYDHVFIRHPSGQALDARGLHPMPEGAEEVDPNHLRALFNAEAFVGWPEDSKEGVEAHPDYAEGPEVARRLIEQYPSAQ